MCLVIFVVLPREADGAAVERVFAAHQLGFRVVENPVLGARLADGDFIVSTETAGCDCHTPLGVRPLDVEAVTAQMRAAGVSDGKIAVRLTQLRAQESARQRASVTVETWRAAISQALAHTPRIGVLLHWFNGNIATEDIAFSRQPGTLDVAYLAGLAKDTLHEFVA